MSEAKSITIVVEVAFASTDAQVLIELSLPSGATVADAIVAADLQSRFPQYDFSVLATGIWGSKVSRRQQLSHGDRVEVYRELAREPMEARRVRVRDSTPDPSGSH